MIAPLVAAAGIGAAGSVISGITGGKGAKRAAKIQQQTAQQQIAAQNQLRSELTAQYQPTIDRGNAAGGLIGSFLGLEGGDRAAAALGQYRASTGYQDRLDTGLGAVNSNAYARGMGDSGATRKALQRTGMAIADQSSGQWLNGLGALQSAGQGGINAIAGIGQNTVSANNAALGGVADTQSNAALYQSGLWGNALQQIGNVAGSYLGGQQAARSGTSYLQGAGGMAPARSRFEGQGYFGPMTQAGGGYIYGGYGGRT